MEKISVTYTCNNHSVSTVLLSSVGQKITDTLKGQLIKTKDRGRYKEVPCVTKMKEQAHNMNKRRTQRVQ